jgi:hypothetical protein
MPIDVLCPQCQQRYKLKADKVGKPFRCIKCQNQFVPTSSPTPQQTLSASNETIMGVPPPPPPGPSGPDEPKNP